MTLNGLKIVNSNTEYYYEFDEPYLSVFLKVKVHPKLITKEAIEAFNSYFHYKDYTIEQLEMIKAGIKHLFTTLRHEAEIKRDFDAYDDYMARESTFLTLINIQLNKKESLVSSH